MRVIHNFIERQGESLYDGIVLRRCEKLVSVGYHSESGMPLSEEYRAFFLAESDVVVATVRAYREGRHGSEKWANRAAFSEATDLFRFRTIPGVKISTDMRLFCDGSVFEITSVEDVKGRGMYIEAFAKEVKPSG